MKTRVLFRADASVEIGTGHIMRCATLGQALKNQGADIIFACRALPVHLMDWLRQKQFSIWHCNAENVQSLDFFQTPVDWLVVDHYALDAEWETAARFYCQKILVIDDLANRPHHCDYLLDASRIDSDPNRYHELLNADCKSLFGPHYALLRPEFEQERARQHADPIVLPQAPFRILIFFGGSDPTGESWKALNAVRRLSKKIPVSVDFIAGGSNPEKSVLRLACNNLPNVRFHEHLDHLAALMAEADFALGAGGITSWERLCLGLPSVVVAIAENQVSVSTALHREGAHLYLGESHQVTTAQMQAALLYLMESPEIAAKFRAKGRALVDGKGVQRVLQAIHLQAAPSLER